MLETLKLAFYGLLYRLYIINVLHFYNFNSVVSNIAVCLNIQIFHHKFDQLLWHSRLARRTYKQYRRGLWLAIYAVKCEGREFEPLQEQGFFSFFFLNFSGNLNFFFLCPLYSYLNTLE